MIIFHVNLFYLFQCNNHSKKHTYANLHPVIHELFVSWWTHGFQLTSSHSLLSLPMNQFFSLEGNLKFEKIKNHRRQDLSNTVAFRRQLLGIWANNPSSELNATAHYRETNYELLVHNTGHLGCTTSLKHFKMDR